MERLIETPFFQAVSGSTPQREDYKLHYSDFICEVFDLCTAPDTDYLTLLFTLNHTTIELTSLQEILSDDEAGKKCGLTSLHPQSNPVYRKGVVLRGGTQGTTPEK